MSLSRAPVRSSTELPPVAVTQHRLDAVLARLPADVTRVPTDPVEAAAANRRRLETVREAAAGAAAALQEQRRREQQQIRQIAAVVDYHRARMALRAREDARVDAVVEGHRVRLARTTGLLQSQLTSLQQAEARRDDPTAGQALVERIDAWASSGRALADARQRLGVSQRQLAQEACCSRGHVFDMEQDPPERLGRGPWLCPASAGGGTPATASARTQARQYLATVLARHLHPLLDEGDPL